jgi:hypothetical protein
LTNKSQGLLDEINPDDVLTDMFGDLLDKINPVIC